MLQLTGYERQQQQHQTQEEERQQQQQQRGETIPYSGRSHTGSPKVGVDIEVGALVCSVRGQVSAWDLARERDGCSSAGELH